MQVLEIKKQKESELKEVQAKIEKLQKGLQERVERQKKLQEKAQEVIKEYQDKLQKNTNIAKEQEGALVSFVTMEQNLIAQIDLLSSMKPQIIKSA